MTFLKVFFCHQTRVNEGPEFFYQLKELNDYVDWLPGTEEKLNDSQLNLAFYNGLPGSWCVKFMIASWSVHTENCPELLQYFQVQEHQQDIIDSKNEALQAKACAKLECGQAMLSWQAEWGGKSEEHMKAHSGRIQAPARQTTPH
jgi:hypothetical protein